MKKRKNKSPFSTRKKRKKMDRFFSKARRKELKGHGFTDTEIRKAVKRMRSNVRRGTTKKYPLVVE